VETVETQPQAFHRSHERLEIATAAISTFPRRGCGHSLSPNQKKTKKQNLMGPWKSGNPKSGFPLSHRPGLPATQGRKDEKEGFSSHQEE